MQTSASPYGQSALRLSSNPPPVTIEPSDIVARRTCALPGLQVETVAATAQATLDCHYRSSWHLLIAAQRGERVEGESSVEGLPTSRLRSFSGRMTFVPAGHMFHGWALPSVLPQMTYFYIDPKGPVLDQEALDGIALKPRLFFSDSELWRVVDRLRDASLSCTSSRYGEALGVVLGHELIRANEAAVPASLSRGGLSGWQQKTLTDYIEANLGTVLRLTDMAQLVRLSPYHFAHAFKQSFGVPPHRYHVGRRIARAKDLLVDPENSVTAIARELGFAETSSFSSTFRRVTGASPSDFRRAAR
ncbi:MAG: helix-turn-helix domain-containing protein [Pseudolabrys sp.]